MVFNSGGTEANAQGIASALAAGCERLIVSATEHPCVAETAANAGVAVEVTLDDVGRIVAPRPAAGRLDLDDTEYVAVFRKSAEADDAMVRAA